MNLFMRSLFFITFILPLQAAASGDTCTKIEKILERAAEERCELISEEAEVCFIKLDQKLARAEKSKKAKKLSKVALEIIKGSYEDAIQTVEIYLMELKKENPPCLNQEGEVEAVIDELKKDFTILNKWAIPAQ